MGSDIKALKKKRFAQGKVKIHTIIIMCATKISPREDLHHALASRGLFTLTIFSLLNSTGPI